MYKRNALRFKLLILFLIYNFLLLNIQAADLIVFSYNRPMQLYALLESCELYLTGTASTTVIYRVSGLDYQAGYELVQARFKNVNFVKQQNPPDDFKKLVQQYAFEQTSSKYIMFAVDDLFVKAPVDILECIKHLERFRAYTFSLRLGLRINYCCMIKQVTPRPPVKLVTPEVYQFCFKDGRGDWRYPNSLDMHIYRKHEIYEKMFSGEWNNPSFLEGAWASRANLNQTGLFFSDPKVVNIPVNIVQNVVANYAMHSYKIEDLLNRFMHGSKIDIGPIARLENYDAHTDFEISFVKR
jgi:hypothetical protein